MLIYEQLISIDVAQQAADYQQLLRKQGTYGNNSNKYIRNNKSKSRGYQLNREFVYGSSKYCQIGIRVALLKTMP
ncbi:MAG: hypothetical protein ABL919_05585 [Methylococcales bacterium]|nr:hypothetical protein [Methylococcaceae bacterium]